MTNQPGSEPVDPRRAGEDLDQDPQAACRCPDCDTPAPRRWTEEELGPELAEDETFDDPGRWGPLTGGQSMAASSSSERPAELGERCTCGRQANVVYLGSVFGPTGDCGIRDGGDRTGPCPFCGGPRHSEFEGRCPSYQLRLDGVGGEAPRP